MVDNDIKNHNKRPFNQMNTDLIDIDHKPSKRIVVSKLQTPTKINQISLKSDYDIDFSRSKGNNPIDNNLDLFYQENESKLKDLEIKLETLNQRSDEQNKIYVSLKETLNDDYNLKKENLQEIVDNLMSKAQDIKNSTDEIKGSFNDKSESLNKRYASKQLDISKEYRKKLKAKLKSFYSKEKNMKKKQK